MSRKLLALALLFMACSAQARDDDDGGSDSRADAPGMRTKSGIGVSGGYFTGIGLTYRQFLFDGLGIQLVAPGAGKYKTYSAVFLFRPASPGFYVIAGASRVHYERPQLCYGAGPGLEFPLISSRVGFFIELPAYLTYDFGTKNDPGIGLFPNAGLLVHF